MADFDLTRVAGNIGAMNALNALTNINKQLSVHQTRLATGKRINSAADDPAGLSIATKMLARSEGLKVALSNIGDAKSLLAVAESGMGRINDILVQMRNKAESGASDTLGANERDALVKQMQAYAAQINDIVDQTKWTSSSDSLIGGDFLAVPLRFQTGADANDVTSLSGLKDLSASRVGSLELANSVAAARAATFIEGGAVTAVAVGAPGNPNLTELASGSYVVRVTAGGGGDTSTVQLFSASDTAFAHAILVDANGVDDANPEAVNTAITVDTNPAGAVVNFGNGLSVTLGAVTAGVATGVVNYTQESTELTLRLDATTTLTKDSTAAQFASYMSVIQSKLDVVSEQISMLGALNGRLSFKEDHVSAAQINTEGAYNRIMNANMAEEQVNASKFMILQQTATAMLAQANAAPQFLLSLFR